MGASESYDDYDAGTGLLITCWTLTGVAVLVIFLRLIAKNKIGNLNIDDAVMVFALITLIIGDGLVTAGVHYGLGRHASILDHGPEVKAVMYYCISQSFGIVASTIGRMAFIMFLARLFPSSSVTRTVLWALFAIQPIVNIIAIFLMFLQCHGEIPPLFDFTLPQDNCMPLSVQINYAYFQGCFNTVSDLFLAAFPTYIFWSLKLRLRVKVALLCLLSLGIFAMAASIVKTVELNTIAHTEDPTVDQVLLLRWVYIEATIVLITSSIPCLRPLFVAMSKNFSSYPRQTYEMDGSYGHGYGRSRSSKYHAQDRRQRGDGDSERVILENSNGGITKHVTVTVQDEALAI
ncbi:hypothetical protein N7456_000621 [Penicillium angulare]|uniref:Rhodopsin domain-containing protein n=1 Tax=Penicillium angulare TaxID=116970 RepID=A0A9W9GDU6_9EURO|nr:hypothetical protein N7456_000621 [Penicillium angulare]